MKSIVIVTSEFPPTPAAAASRVSTWITELEVNCCQVSTFTSSNILNPGNSVQCSFFRTPDNHAGLLKRFCQEIFLGFDIGLRLLYQRKFFDLCIITSPPFFMAVICAFFCRLAELPFAFDVRDRYPKVLYDLNYISKGGLLSKVLNEIENWIYTNAQYASTVTQGLLDDLRKDFPQQEEKFMLVRNGFDESLFEERLLHSEKYNPFTVVYHGRLGRFYDSDALIEVIDLVNKTDSQIRFLLIGDLPKTFIENLGKNVKTIDALPLNQLAEVISKCHLGICILKDLPAMKKAFPAKVYDFIGAGLPVLIAPGGELADMVNQSKIGVTFSEINPINIAAEIIRLKNDQVRMKSLRSSLVAVRSEFGRRLASRDFVSRLVGNQFSE